MLKKVLIALVAIAAIALIAAAILPKQMDYEKSIAINAPKTAVWTHINSMKGIDSWSPWNAYEPDMKKQWSGTSGEVGETMTWDGKEENVGAGSQTIKKLDEPNRVETDIIFTRPWESLSNAFVNLEETDGVTTATWGFHSEMTWPMNLFPALMDMEENMGADWTNGLNKLKELSEATAEANALRAQAAAAEDFAEEK